MVRPGPGKSQWLDSKQRTGLAVTVDPFTRKHNQVHNFDDPKQLYGSTRTLPVSRISETMFEVEMGG